MHSPNLRTKLGQPSWRHNVVSKVPVPGKTLLCHKDEPGVKLIIGIMACPDQNLERLNKAAEAVYHIGQIHSIGPNPNPTTSPSIGLRGVALETILKLTAFMKMRFALGLLSRQRGSTMRSVKNKISGRDKTLKLSFIIEIVYNNNNNNNNNI